LLVVKALVPGWDQHLVSFMSGGLLGVLLFRVWVMVLTSLGGTLLLTYSSLCLLERFTKLNAVEFADQRDTLLNWVCGGLVALGVLRQLLLNRGKWAGQNRGKSAEGKWSRAPEKPEPESRRGWLSWPPFRKAG